MGKRNKIPPAIARDRTDYKKLSCLVSDLEAGEMKLTRAITQLSESNWEKMKHVVRGYARYRQDSYARRELLRQLVVDVEAFLATDIIAPLDTHSNKDYWLKLRWLKNRISEIKAKIGGNDEG